MALLLRLAWRNLWRHSRRTLLTAIAIAVAVATCMGTVALQAGMFQRMFETLVERRTGHAQVHHPDFPGQRAIYDVIPDGPRLLEALREVPAIASATPRTYGFALIGAGNEAMGARLIGADPEGERRLTGLAAKVVRGSYLGPEARQEVLIGSGVADHLHAEPGDEIVAVTQAADGSLGNELYRVRGVYETGSLELDRATVVLHKDDLDRLLVLEGGIHEIALLAPTRADIPGLLTAARPLTEDAGAVLRSWEEINPTAARMIGIQNVAIWIVVAIVFGVSAIGILNTMLMSVFERTRELGVLIALGLTPLKVLALIVLETLLLSLVGTFFGALLGGALDVWLIVHGLDLSGTGEITTAGVSFSATLKGRFVLADALTILLAVVIFSTLTALWPAARAARLAPVVAMQER